MWSPTLGDTVKCKITGFIGTVVGVATFIDGGDQVLVRGNASEPNKYPDAVWLKTTHVAPAEATTK